MNAKMERGMRIREERGRLHMTQAEAGAAIGVSREMFARYEAGSMPGDDVIGRMRSAGFDVDYVLAGVRRNANALPKVGKEVLFTRQSEGDFEEDDVNSNFAARLREERGRLGLTQEQMGEAGGVKKQAQSLYESGKRKPDVGYLDRVSAIGVDVVFLLTGVRAEDVGFSPQSMESIGERLREERERYQLSQSEVASIASEKGVSGTTRQSQSRYEQGKQQPGVLYMVALGEAGFDVGYIMTGVRSALSSEHFEAAGAIRYESKPLVSMVTTDGEANGHVVQSHDELAWREVLIIAVDELRAAGLSLSGEKLAEVVDLLVEFQKHGLATTRDAIRKQIRLVA